MMWNGPFGGGDWTGWGWFGPFHFVLPILFWALIITGVVMLVRYAAGWNTHSVGPGMMGHGMHGRSALDALEERYARGEIGRDEYLEKKKDIVR